MVANSKRQTIRWIERRRTAKVRLGRAEQPQVLVENLYERVAPKSVECIQSFGAGNYEITFKTVDLKEKACLLLQNG